MYFDRDKLDWAMGELLAYGTLLQEGLTFVFQVKMLNVELSLTVMLYLKSENSEQ